MKKLIVKFDAVNDSNLIPKLAGAGLANLLPVNETPIYCQEVSNFKDDVFKFGVLHDRNNLLESVNIQGFPEVIKLSTKDKRSVGILLIFEFTASMKINDPYGNAQLLDSFGSALEKTLDSQINSIVGCNYLGSLNLAAQLGKEYETSKVFLGGSIQCVKKFFEPGEQKLSPDLFIRNEEVRLYFESPHYKKLLDFSKHGGLHTALAKIRKGDLLAFLLVRNNSKRMK